MILRGYVERRVVANEAIDGELAILLMNHANMHFQQLQKKNPNQAAQLEEPLQQMAQFLGQQVAKEQQMQQAAQAAQAPAEEAAVPVEGGYE